VLSFVSSYKQKGLYIAGSLKYYGKRNLQDNTSEQGVWKS